MTEMVNRVVLVTGGAGYVGAHACKALHRAGYTPVVYDNLSRGSASAVRWGELERGDILDRERLALVLARYRPTAVLHFAALAYVSESVSDPAAYYRNNVAGTLTLLEAMLAGRIRRLVFSSTCATYGLPERLPLREDAPQRPINPYGASKLMVERMLRDFAAAHGLGAVALRYFNAAGSDIDGDIGEDHDPETHLVPLVLQAGSGTGPPVSIFGTDYDTPDGTCVRDYVHVSDLAEAHVLALRAIPDSGGFEAFNLGNERGFSVCEVVTAAGDVIGREIPCRLAPRRAGDPPILIADASRARRVLGWRPRHGSLDKIISTAWAWECKKRQVLVPEAPAPTHVSSGPAH